MNKPLTKEERERIAQAWSGTPFEGLDVRLVYALETIQQLRSAESFWREAVKNTKLIRRPAQGADDYDCGLCNGDIVRYNDGRVKGHTLDCPWLLAQS